MTASRIALALIAPYIFAWLTSLFVDRVSLLPVGTTDATIVSNNNGKLASQQRLALLVYNLPELIFALVALLIAFLWQPEAGLRGLVLRWGLAGMALVRLGISWPAWRDLVSGQVESMSGPLRKIQFRQRRALAIEDGPIVVLPVEQRLFERYDAGIAATIYYAPHSKRVVAVLPHNVPVASVEAVPVS